MSAKPIRFAVAAVFAAGCASSANRPHDHLAERICPPGVSAVDSSRATLSNREFGAHQPESLSERASQTVIPASATVSSQAGSSELPGKLPGDGVETPLPMHASIGSVETTPAQMSRITLPEAIETSFRMQPRLRVFLENIDEAQG